MAEVDTEAVAAAMVAEVEAMEVAEEEEVTVVAAEEATVVVVDNMVAAAANKVVDSPMAILVAAFIRLIFKRQNWSISKKISILNILLSRLVLRQKLKPGELPNKWW